MQFIDILALLALAMLITRLFAGVLRKLRLPENLGDLFAGIVLGNLGTIGPISFDALATSDVVQALSMLGVVTLVFSAGLASDLSSSLQAKWRTLAVLAGAFGAPLVLAVLLRKWLPSPGIPNCLLLAGILGASSMGITTQALRKAQLLRTVIGQTILGMGTVCNFVAILTVTVSVSVATHGGLVGAQNFAIILAEMCLLGVVVFLAREVLLPRGVFRPSGPIDRASYNIILLSIAVLFSWFSGAMGLVTVVGAFMFGLILDEVHIARQVGGSGATVESFIKPLTDYFVPIFFISIGLQLKLAVFKDPEVLTLIGLYVVITVVGKVAATLAIPKSIVANSRDRLLFFMGTLAQGEIGLLFVALGYSTGAVPDNEAAAQLSTVVLTSMIAPTVLAWTTWIKPGEKPLPLPVVAPPAPPASTGSGLLGWVRGLPFWFRVIVAFGPIIAISADFLSYIRRCERFADMAEMGTNQLTIPTVPHEAIVIPTGNTDRVPLGLKLLKERESEFALITGPSDPPLDIPALIKEIWGANADVNKISQQILIEPNAQTTYQNAEFSTPMLNQRGIKRVILINTDCYLPRALTIFKSFLPNDQIIPYATPSGFTRLSLSLTNQSIDGITLRWWEFCKNIIWDIYARLKRFKDDV